KSSLMRNVLQATRYRLDSDGKIDAISEMLRTAFVSVSVPVKCHVQYEHAGLKGEVDVLVATSGTVFAFECKNSLHPCNPFELRQSYEYIQKGFEQLTRFKQLFTNEAFLAKLEQRTK